MGTPLSNPKQQGVARAMSQADRWPQTFPNLTPTFSNVVWGAGPNEVYDHYVGPGSGSRRVIVYCSYGGGTVGDHKQPALSGSGGGNALAYFVTASPAAEALGPTDFVSVNYEKLRWDSPTAVTHIPPYVATSNPTLYPAQQSRLAVFFNTYLPAVAASKSWDLSRVHAFGSSHGGVLLGLQMLRSGLPIKTLIIESPIPDYRNNIIFWTTAEGMYGDASAGAWAARSLADKALITQLLEFGGSIPGTYRPMYLVNAQTGDGVVPYGSTAGGSIHDFNQWIAYTDELTNSAPVGSFDGEICERGGWQSPHLGANAVSQRVMEWAVAHE